MKNFAEYQKENTYNSKISFTMDCGTDVCVEIANGVICLEKRIFGLDYATKVEKFPPSVEYNCFDKLMERAEFLYLSKTSFFVNKCSKELIENNN